MKAILLAVALGAACCAPALAKPKPPSPMEAAAQFKAGVTTYGDVVAVLGAPTSISVNGDGSRVAAYETVKAHPKLASFVPVVGLFAGGSKGTSSTAVFVFSADGTLKTYSVTDSTVDCGVMIVAVSCKGAGPVVSPVPTAPASAPAAAQSVPATVVEEPTPQAPSSTPASPKRKCVRVPTDPSQSSC